MRQKSRGQIRTAVSPQSLASHLPILGRPHPRPHKVILGRPLQSHPRSPSPVLLQSPPRSPSPVLPQSPPHSPTQSPACRPPRSLPQSPPRGPPSTSSRSWAQRIKRASGRDRPIADQATAVGKKASAQPPPASVGKNTDKRSNKPAKPLRIAADLKGKVEAQLIDEILSPNRISGIFGNARRSFRWPSARGIYTIPFFWRHCSLTANFDYNI
jgi:hypothetical protein